MWELKVQFEGDEPEEEVIDDLCEKVAKALDRADVEHFDVTL